MRTETVQIIDMNDQNAASTITQALKQLAGVAAINISLDDKNASVSFDETLASKHGLRMTIEDLGFALAKPVHGEEGECCGGCGG